MIEGNLRGASSQFGDSEPLPFPFNQSTFCLWEPIESRIDHARILVVDNLFRDEGDISEVARRSWGKSIKSKLNREREIASMALENIVNNVKRLVREPETEVTHLANVAATAAEFQPDAIVLSGTLSDFDFYNPALLNAASSFLRSTRIPVLGICGGHQLVGLAFGAQIVTLDDLAQHEQRDARPVEYQYRFIRLTKPDDLIFNGIHERYAQVFEDRSTEGRILRVWQNHGLQLDRVPDGFELLATAYLCRIQMMVKRSDGQLIYTVQFHLEKSFEDWHKNPTRWEHPNQSRDGRIIFESFLFEALKHCGKAV